MSIKKKNQKVFLVFILLLFFMPSIMLYENRISSHASFSLDTSLINKIDLTRIYNITEQLSSYTTRETGTLQCNLAASDIHTMLNETFNVTDSFYEYFTFNGSLSSNVIGRINGTTLQEEIVIISAHYDSISNFGNAPGANDNAVAVALCMEVLGVIQNNAILNRTLLFISYAGEEQAFIGSQAWINQHKGELSKVVAVINLDMIGYGSYISIIKNTQSEWLADAIIRASETIDVNFMKSNSPYPENTRFDHDTFWLVNLPCVTLFEAGAIYPHYHTSQDTIDKISFPLVEKFAQVTLLSLLYLGSVKYQHSWMTNSIIIWCSWGIAAILPFLLYRKLK